MALSISCEKLLQSVKEKGVVWVRSEQEFCDAELLHNAGLITAVVSKYNWMGKETRPFRELVLYSSEEEALKDYDTILPRE